MTVAHSHEMAVFARVVERGSFAAAAEDLDLTPSAVSKIIARAEARLGVTLLTRTTRRLSLTPEGEIYLMRSREILAAIENAEAEVARTGHTPSGRVRVSCGTAFAMHYLVPALPDFRRAYPEIVIELGVTDRQVDLVAEQVDVAIRTGHLGDSSLIARRIGQSQRVICASPGYLEARGTPTVPADLARHDCMTITGFSALTVWPFSTPEGVNRFAVEARFSSDSAEVLRRMAIADQGLVRLARFLLIRDIEAGRLVPLLTDCHVAEPFPLSAVMPAGPHRAPRIRAFVDFLVTRFAKTPF